MATRRRPIETGNAPLTFEIEKVVKTSYSTHIESVVNGVDHSQTYFIRTAAGPKELFIQTHSFTVPIEQADTQLTSDMCHLIVTHQHREIKREHG